MTAGDRGPDDYRKARIIIAFTIAGLIVFLGVIDALGRLFVDAGFHISDLAVGALSGTILLLLGVTVPRWWPGGRG